MKLRAAQKELEDYFSKEYEKKYTELGGYYYIKGYKNLSKSLMQQYFSSGKYKELNDPKLDAYWKEVRKSELKRNVFFMIVIVLFYVLTSV